MMYVVSIAVDVDRADEWEAWMRSVHVPDVMETGCFAEAVLARDAAHVAAGSPDALRRAYRVQYRAHDHAALEQYQAEHATRLQAEHTERYAGAFQASRNLYPIVERWSTESSVR